MGAHTSLCPIIAGGSGENITAWPIGVCGRGFMHCGAKEAFIKTRAMCQKFLKGLLLMLRT